MVLRWRHSSLHINPARRFSRSASSSCALPAVHPAASSCAISLPSAQEQQPNNEAQPLRQQFWPFRLEYEANPRPLDEVQLLEEHHFAADERPDIWHSSHQSPQSLSPSPTSLARIHLPLGQVTAPRHVVDEEPASSDPSPLRWRAWVDYQRS